MSLLVITTLVGCGGQTLAEPQVRTSISGDAPYATIAGLQRGQTTQVPLTLNNPHQEAIEVFEITIRVDSVSEARCPESALTLKSFPKPIIGPQSSGIVLLTLGLNDDSPKVCDSATWRVEFSSEARVAS
jgi:hypothetical protein